MRLNSGVLFAEIKQHVQLLSNTVIVGLFDSLKMRTETQRVSKLWPVYWTQQSFGICCLTLHKPKRGALVAVETGCWRGFVNAI